MIRDLPSHRIPITAGLSTKFEPGAVAGALLFQADNVDAFDEFLSLGKLPGSSKINSVATDPIASVHYFEFFDYDRQQKRRMVIATGGVPTLRRVDLSTGVVSSLALLDASEPMVEAKMNYRLHLSSPNQGKGENVPTGGLKYDGTRVTNWGVIEPGLSQTELEAFDDHLEWTQAVGGATLTTETTNVIRGSSVRISNPASSGDVAIQKTYSPNIDIDPNGTGLLRMWVFLPSGSIQALTNSASTPALSVIFLSGGTAFPTPANQMQFDVSASQLVLGWNLLAFDMSAPTSVGGGFNSADVQLIRVHADFPLTNPALDGLQYDNLYTLAVSAPTPAVAAAASTIKVGNYRYVITYVTEYGLESNAGLPSASVNIPVNNVSVINLTAFPASTDPSVRSIRLYREKDGTGDFQFVVELPNDAAVTYQDTLDQVSLSTVTPPFAGDLILDNSPPVAFSEATVIDNRVFAIDAADRRTVLISEAGQPEAFPLVAQIIFDEELTAIRRHSIGTLIYSFHAVYLLSGSGTVSSPFSVELVTTDLGANSRRQVVEIRGRHLVVREKEVYFVQDPDVRGSAQSWYLNGPVQDQWDEDLLDTAMQSMFMIHDRKRFRVVYFGVGSGGTATEIWVQQYGTKGFQQITGDGAGTDPLDVRVAAWYRMTLPAGVTPNAAVIGERDAEQPELWLATEEGFVYQLQDPDATQWATASGVANVSSTIQPASVPLGSGSGGRGTPRYLKIAAESAAQATWSCTIDLLTGPDGDTIASSTFNLVFPAGKSEPIFPIPQMGAKGEWCRITLTNAENIAAPLIRTIELFYITRPDFRGQRPA